MDKKRWMMLGSGLLGRDLTFIHNNHNLDYNMNYCVREIINPILVTLLLSKLGVVPQSRHIGPTIQTKLAQELT